jgi:hypothetical protein
MFSDGQFAGWVGQKYGILGQQAAAATTGADASYLRASADANLANTQAREFPASAASLRAYQGSETGLNTARTGQVGAETTRQNQLNDPYNPTSDGHYDSLGNWVPGATGFSKGTASVTASDAEVAAFHQHILHATQGANKVPGKGPSTVDTVPAMLAPREAVLNEHAADLIGRDKIAAANAIGVAHQKAQAGPGMVAAKGKPAAPTHQKLAGGTHMVGHGKSAKTPSKIDPQALLSLMGAMQGGQAGGGAPMGGGQGMV